MGSHIFEFLGVRRLSKRTMMFVLQVKIKVFFIRLKKKKKKKKKEREKKKKMGQFIKIGSG